MSKPVPPIHKYMSTSPHTIGAEQTIAMAAKVMAEHRIRHLPVLHGGKVVGGNHIVVTPPKPVETDKPLRPIRVGLRG